MIIIITHRIMPQRGVQSGSRLVSGNQPSLADDSVAQTSRSVLPTESCGVKLEDLPVSCHRAGVYTPELLSVFPGRLGDSGSRLNIDRAISVRSRKERTGGR